jgi:putative oxidoreductase
MQDMALRVRQEVLVRTEHYDSAVLDVPEALRPFFATAGPWLHALLRIGAGLLFMQHGAQKMFGLLGGFGAPGATAPLVSLMGLAGILEFFGGLLIVVGLLTRPVAVLLAGEMVVAFVMAHMPQGGFPVQNGGELPLLFALTFLFLFGAGAGPLSMDRAWAGRRAGRQTSETAPAGIGGARRDTTRRESAA